MLHGPPAFSKIKHSSQRTREIVFRPLDGDGQVKALGQIGGNGAGQSTAGAVGVWIVNVSSIELSPDAVPIEKIVGVIDIMSAFEEDSTAVGVTDASGSSLNV